MPPSVRVSVEGSLRVAPAAVGVLASESNRGRGPTRASRRRLAGNKRRTRGFRCANPRIIVAMAELIGGYSVGPRSTDRLAKLHTQLATIREKVFAGRR